MSNFELEQVKRLPQQADEVWQGAIIRMPTWVRGDDGQQPFRPSLPIWLAVRNKKIASGEMVMPDAAQPQLLWDALLRFANDEEIGGYRPGRVEFNDPVMLERFAPALKEAGIEVAYRDSLPALERVTADIAEHLRGGPLPPGWDSAGDITIEQMRRYAEAAALFFRAAAWRHLGNEDLLAIESPKAPAGMRYATVLGGGGQMYGLGFYNKPDEKWAIYDAPHPADYFASRKHGVWSLFACDLTELPYQDADLWQTHELPVAAEDRYPCLLCYRAKEDVRRPKAEQLAFAELLLRALAATTEKQIDAGRWTVQVAAADGSVDVTLALPDLLDPPDRQQWMRRGVEPDRRAMEQLHVQIGRFLEEKQIDDMDQANALIQKEFIGKPIDPDRFPPRTELEKAQALCFKAFDTHGRRRMQLARQALATCPDCADAYVMLAENTSDPREALDYYAAGVAAGDRALGAERFEEDAGHFWDQVDTRPYMRARLGLAQCLEAFDRNQEALEHYRDLLRLNPRDNQGVRHLYLSALLKCGHDREAARFMANAEQEDSATWCYTRALLAFRLDGDTPRARRELDKAIDVNPHVLELLLAEEQPLDFIPPSYSLGSIEEAIIGIDEIGEAFARSPGALDWLNEYREHHDRQAQLKPKKKWKQRKRRRR